MTAVLLDFPDTMERGWLMLRRELDANLSALGYSPAFRERIAANMRPMFEVCLPGHRHHFPLALPASFPVDEIPALCASIEGQVAEGMEAFLREHRRELFYERLRREMGAAIGEGMR